MAANEERNLRREKRQGKRRIAKRNRAKARRVLNAGDAAAEASQEGELASARLEAAHEDPPLAARERVGHIHVGRNKPKPGGTRN